MKGRLMFIAGIATGFVLGSRAGRRTYDDIKERVQHLGSSPVVQKGLGKANEIAESRAPEATAKVKQAVAATADTASGVAGAVKDPGSADSASSDSAPSPADVAKNIGSTVSDTAKETASSAADAAKDGAKQGARDAAGSTDESTVPTVTV